jgi:pilus assembly protein Flp/PilA
MTEQRGMRHAFGDGIASLVKECSGSTAIEYAVIAAGISIAIVATVAGIGSEVSALFVTVAGFF